MKRKRTACRNQELSSVSVSQAPQKYTFKFPKFERKQQLCVTCNHFTAKTSCTFGKCKRCCGKYDSKRCESHEVVYRKERSILLAKRQSEHNSDCGREQLFFQEFTEEIFSSAGETCIIFLASNFLCLPEIRKWLHRLNKGNANRK